VYNACTSDLKCYVINWEQFVHGLKTSCSVARTHRGRFQERWRWVVDKLTEWLIDQRSKNSWRLGLCPRLYKILFYLRRIQHTAEIVYDGRRQLRRFCFHLWTSRYQCIGLHLQLSKSLLHHLVLFSSLHTHTRAHTCTHTTIITIIIRATVFLRQILPNSTVQFVKFCGAIISKYPTFRDQLALLYKLTTLQSIRNLL